MFANRIAIVTGGAAGIGRATCNLLAKENASIVVADLNLKGVQETIQSLPKSTGKHLAVELDVSKKDSVYSMFDQIRKNYGETELATLVVNCAGMTKDNWLIEMSEDDFDRVIDVNLKGTFYTTKMACKLMIDQKKTDLGSIVNVGSISGKIGNMAQANYASSKAAVESFTKTVSKEMGRYNIRCNCVMPGFIETQMVETVPEKIMMGMLYMTPLGRTGQPEEVAEAIKFLLSPMSSYITGATLQVSGGLFA